MLALAVHRAGLCPLCGGPLAECSPKRAKDWTVPAPRRCARTDLLLLAQEGSKKDRPQALLWRTEKKAKKKGGG